MLQAKLYKLSVILVIVGALNWGLVGALNIDLVEMLSTLLNVPSIQPLVYIAVGLAALYLASHRDLYLPFLGRTVVPSGFLTEKTPRGANALRRVLVKPNSKVVYWASETNHEILQNPWLAYDNYTNAGVTTSDHNGVAQLHVRFPSRYRVPYKWHNEPLPPHIHYRVCEQPGMLSEVRTVNFMGAGLPG